MPINLLSHQPTILSTLFAAHKASKYKNTWRARGRERASAGCGGTHRTLRFPPRLISTHFSLLFIYLGSISHRSLHGRPERRPPPRHHSSPPSPPLPAHPPAITAASPRSRPGWLHSRRRSRGSPAPSPSSTPAGVLSASTKVGSLPLSVPPLPRSVHELIFLLFRPDALAFGIPCFSAILMLS